MTLWSKCVEIALVGAERAGYALEPMAAEHETLARLMAQMRDWPAERRLLSLAAIVAQWMQAGRTLPHDADPLPEPIPAGERSCPPATTALLREILQGQFPATLPELLAALAARGMELPLYYLPDLLDRLPEQPTLAPLLQPLLGERGRWLVQQNPAWRDWLEPDPPDLTDPLTWVKADRATARLTRLRALRQQAPHLARETLALFWAKERVAERAALLKALELHLGPEDEPFIEAALNDRGRAAREAAADLLASQPTSALVRRMIERAQSCLTLTEPTPGVLRLVVEPPEACDADMIRDGIVAEPPRGHGERGWWLQQLLERVPPATWTKRYGYPPDVWIALAAETDFGSQLVGGWIQAAQRYHDADWLLALLRHLATLPGSHEFLALLQAMPDPQRRTWLIHWLKQETIVEQVAALKCHPGPWDETFSQEVLRWMHTYVLQQDRAGVWALNRELEDFGLQMAATLAAEAGQGWPDLSNWQPEQLLAPLTFRQALLRSLDAPHH